MQVVLYKSGNPKKDDATIGALEGLGFLVSLHNIPHGYKDGPSPVAHFCGEGVVFGQDGIIAFAKRLRLHSQEER